MQEMFEEIRKTLGAEEYKIFIMKFFGFTFEEISEEYNILRTDLPEKWKQIKGKLLRRVVSKIK